LTACKKKQEKNKLQRVQFSRWRKPKRQTGVEIYSALLFATEKSKKLERVHIFF